MWNSIFLDFSPLSHKHCPGHALCDVDTKVFKTVHSLHRGPVDIKGVLVPSLLFPKVHYQFVSLADIQG